jgi:hypothetical protein
MGTLSRSNCEHFFKKHIERGVGKSKVIRDNNSFLSHCDESKEVDVATQD